MSVFSNPQRYLFKSNAYLLRFVLASTLTPLLYLSQNCYAGRPMNVDDASITQAHQCQLQSWVQHSHEDNQYWLSPACNFTENYEWTLGVAQDAPKTDSKTTLFNLQMKSLIPALSSTHIATAISFAAQNSDRNFNQVSTALNVPVTFTMPNSNWLVHSNLGFSRESGERKFMTWGLGTEYTFSKFNLAAEVYGNPKDHTDWQIGLRHWLIQDVLEIDGSYGQHINNNDAFMSLGMIWVLPI